MNRERFDFLLYENGEENISVNAVVHDESVWLTQKAMAELFGVEVPAVSKTSEEYLRKGRIGNGCNCFQNGNSSAGMSSSKASMKYSTEPRRSILISTGK